MNTGSAHATARALLVTVALCVIALPLAAQDDFRAIDRNRPLRMEDAYPAKFQEWEWQLGTEVGLAEGGDFGIGVPLELKTGFARNWQLGLEVHTRLTETGGVSRGGVESFGAHVLFNLNQEGKAMPAVAARGDVETPGVGDVGRENFGGQLTGILTRSFKRTRFHVNGSYSWASSSDGGNFWSAGLAFEQPLGLSSRLVLGDVYAEFPSDGGDARVWVELGARMQLTKVTVLDFGLSTRADQWTDGTPNIGLIIGLSRVFGFAGLVNVPPYPHPRIN